AIGFDQDLSYFRAAELRRRQFAVAQHLAHLGAAQEDVVFLAVGAALRASHAAAGFAPEREVEEQRRDADAARLEFIEDVVSIKAAVVVANASVVAANDEVRAAVVFADQRVKDSFAGTAIA